jgi:hypothetical protein
MRSFTIGFTVVILLLLLSLPRLAAKKVLKWYTEMLICMLDLLTEFAIFCFILNIHTYPAAVANTRRMVCLLYSRYKIWRRTRAHFSRAIFSFFFKYIKTEEVLFNKYIKDWRSI